MVSRYQLTACVYTGIIHKQDCKQAKAFTKPHYLTGMSYLLIAALFPDWYVLSAAMLVNTLMIWVWSKLIGLGNDARPKSTLFNLGFIVSATTFFIIPHLLFYFDHYGAQYQQAF